MVKAGLLIGHGEKRGRYYLAAEPVLAVRIDVVQGSHPDEFADPFVV